MVLNCIAGHLSIRLNLQFVQYASSRAREAQGVSSCQLGWPACSDSALSGQEGRFT